VATVPTSNYILKLHTWLTGLSNQGIISEFFNQHKRYLVGAVKLVLNVEHIAFYFKITVIKILPLSGQYYLENNFALLLLSHQHYSCQYTSILA
jgi:hypothetical protein